MAPVVVYLVLSGSLTLGVCAGVVARVVLNRMQLKRRFGPLYGEYVDRLGGRRGRAVLRAASERFDRELDLLAASSSPSTPAAPPVPPAPPPTWPARSSEPTAPPPEEQQVRPAPES